MTPQTIWSLTTQLGLYGYIRLPFEISLVPAVYQRTMDATLHELPGVLCYLDYIIITISTGKEHLATLAAVFECLCSHDVWLKQE